MATAEVSAISSNHPLAVWLDTMDDGFLAVDGRLRCVCVSPSTEKLLQRGRADVMGRSLEQIFSRRGEAVFLRHAQRALAEAQPVQLDALHRPTSRWLRGRFVPGGEGLRVFLSDIETAQVLHLAGARAPHAAWLAGLDAAMRLPTPPQDLLPLLPAVSATLSALRADAGDDVRSAVAALDASPVPITLKDRAGHYLLANAAFLELCGCTDALGLTDADLFPPDVARRIVADDSPVLVSGSVRVARVTLPVDGFDRRMRVLRFPVGNPAEPLVGAMYLRPKTGLSAPVQHRGRETDRCLVRLAGEVSHDFNNLLTSILGNTSLALEELPAGHPARALLDDSIASTQRAADLTAQLMAYAGRRHAVPRKLNLVEGIHAQLGFLATALPSGVRIEIESHGPAPLVTADVELLQQAVAALVHNAGEALDGKPGVVRLAVGTESIEAGEVVPSSSDEALPAGTYAWLDVMDDGCGMIATTREHMFDPYFANRPGGRGLGLCVVGGLARSHHGALLVESEPGRGTRVRLLLPLAGLAGKPQGRPALRLVVRELGEVLVLDETADTRRRLERGLRSLGYRVTAVHDGVALAQRLGGGDGIAGIVVSASHPHAGAALQALDEGGKIPVVTLVEGAGREARKGHVLVRPASALSVAAALQRH